MIIGVGIDICEIARMRKSLERHGDRFFARICTERERADLKGGDPAVFVAGRFAVKEAFAKVLDGARGVSFHECEVRREPSGRPRMELSGNGLRMATERGADVWHVSISHDAGAAVAVVILEKTR